MFSKPRSQCQRRIGEWATRRSTIYSCISNNLQSISIVPWKRARSHCLWGRASIQDCCTGPSPSTLSDTIVSVIMISIYKFALILISATHISASQEVTINRAARWGPMETIFCPVSAGDMRPIDLHTIQAGIRKAARSSTQAGIYAVESTLQNESLMLLVRLQNAETAHGTVAIVGAGNSIVSRCPCVVLRTLLTL